MDLGHIQAHPRRIFTSGGHDHSGHRVVYWHDQEGEFAGELEGLGIEGLHEDGVALIRVNDEPTLGIKIRVHLDEPERRFRLCQTGPQPDPAEDFLLDIKHWAAPFAADKSTLILRELGLVDELSLKPHIAARARFFAARERMDKLKRLVEPGDGEVRLDLKIMAVLAREQQPLLSVILRRILAEMDPLDLAQDVKTLAEFEKFGVLERFWELIAREVCYQDEHPTLRNLLLRLFTTDFVRHATGAVPDALRHLMLPNGGGANVIVFMDAWRDSSANSRIYDALSVTVVGDLKIGDHLTRFSLDDLEAVDAFLDVEQRIASLLTRDVFDASETVKAARIVELARSRQAAYRANEEKPSSEEAPRAALHAVFEALIHAASLLELKGRSGAHLRSQSAAETWKLHTEKLYRIDQLYRLFNEAADEATAQNWDILKDLRQHIEDVYGNWYLAELGHLRTTQVEQELLPDWRLPGVNNQVDFYRAVVKPILDGSPDKKVVVIISDAFRYEAAQERFAEMSGIDRYRASLGAMLGVLPSYTALGMAALLPHKTLGYRPDGTVLLEDKPIIGLEARNKVLGAIGGISVRASELMEKKKDAGKAFFRPHRLIYVYRDQIDQTADRGNEEKTFSAARGHDGQGWRLAHIPTGSTTAEQPDKQDFGSMIRHRNTP